MLFPVEEEAPAKLTGEELRDLGISRVKAAADPYEIALIEETIRTHARSGREFTALDVRKIIGHLDSPNLMGAMFLSAAKAGLIERVRYIHSKAESRRSGAVAVWRGTAEISRGNYRKEVELPRDKEMVIIEKINKALDELGSGKESVGAKVRVMDYVVKRQCEGFSMIIEAPKLTTETPAAG